MLKAIPNKRSADQGLVFPNVIQTVWQASTVRCCKAVEEATEHPPDILRMTGVFLTLATSHVGPSTRRFGGFYCLPFGAAQRIVDHLIYSEMK